MIKTSGREQTKQNSSSPEKYHRSPCTWEADIQYLSVMSTILHISVMSIILRLQLVPKRWMNRTGGISSPLHYIYSILKEQYQYSYSVSVAYDTLKPHCQQIYLMIPHGKKSTKIRITRKIGKEMENSYRKMKISPDKRHTHKHTETCYNFHIISNLQLRQFA